MLSATPRVPAVGAEYLTVLYDPATGAVAHMHRTTVLRGGTDPGPRERGANAWAALRAMNGGRPLPGLETLEVEPGLFRPGAVHRVDVRTRTLVAEAPGRRG